MTEAARLTLNSDDIERHREWRRSLDNLLAAFILANPNRIKPAVHMTYMELMEWSHKQTETE